MFHFFLILLLCAKIWQIYNGPHFHSSIFEELEKHNLLVRKVIKLGTNSLIMSQNEIKQFG